MKSQLTSYGKKKIPNQNNFLPKYYSYKVKQPQSWQTFLKVKLNTQNGDKVVKQMMYNKMTSKMTS